MTCPHDYRTRYVRGSRARNEVVRYAVRQCVYCGEWSSDFMDVSRDERVVAVPTGRGRGARVMPRSIK